MKTFTKNTVARKSSRDLTNMRNARAASGKTRRYDFLFRMRR